jgi:hypothetical protein
MYFKYINLDVRRGYTKITVGQESINLKQKQNTGKYISRNAFGPCYSGLVAHNMKLSTASPLNLQFACHMLSPIQHYFPRREF